MSSATLLVPADLDAIRSALLANGARAADAEPAARRLARAVAGRGAHVHVRRVGREVELRLDGADDEVYVLFV